MMIQIYNCNGANIATGKRKRGRPPGMKNKPMFPVATCTPDAATLHPHVLEIPAGGDVVETFAAVARESWLSHFRSMRPFRLRPYCGRRFVGDDSVPLNP